MEFVVAALMVIVALLFVGIALHAARDYLVGAANR
jgi:hypothetical protein